MSAPQTYTHAERIARLRGALLDGGRTVPKADATSVIFVGGAARTGTTLLQNVLCSSSTTNPVIAEAAPVRFLMDARRLTVNHARVHPRAYFVTPEAASEFFAGTLATLLRHLRAHHRCSILVLKEPELTKTFCDLWTLIPESLFICTVRDPRDTIVSMLDWGERSRKSGKLHLFQQRDMNVLSDFYTSFYRPFMRHVPDEFLRRLRFVRYEDLVRTPGAIAAQVERFTGVQLDLFRADGDWAHCALDLDDQTSPIRDALTALYGKPISDVHVGSHREVLTAAEQQVIRDRCGFIFRAFDYR